MDNTFNRNYENYAAIYSRYIKEESPKSTNIISPYFSQTPNLYTNYSGINPANYYNSYPLHQHLISKFNTIYQNPPDLNSILSQDPSSSSNGYLNYEERVENTQEKDLKAPRGSKTSEKSASKSRLSKSPRKRTNRFDGVSEEEVSKKFLPDHIDHNLDILIIGINPGLYAAHKGHHYAGPGNHFWKCLYLSGITPEQYTAFDDFRMLEMGIGFTNIVARTTRGSADLSRKEIEEGAKVLLTKLQYYRPKIAVFNGKGIYEVFSKKKDFLFGKQAETIEGTETVVWVMPSSSARCSQLPRAIDKVPFYEALKKLRDHLNGEYPDLAEEELVFAKLKSPVKAGSSGVADPAAAQTQDGEFGIKTEQ